MKDSGITHILTSSPEIKANYIERFHRTFRDRLSRHITQFKKRNWINIYQKIIDQYNASPHSSLSGLSPNDVNKGNAPELFYSMYDKYFRDSAVSRLKRKKHKFNVNDIVRVAIQKKGFQKASNATYTEEVFYINKVMNTFPTTYQITDENGKRIIGAYYDEELQLAN